MEWCICSGGGKTVKGGSSSGVVEGEDEEFVLEILLREPEAPLLGFAPTAAIVEAKPVHFVLRGRKILCILEVVRWVPVEAEDVDNVEGMMMITTFGRPRSST